MTISFAAFAATVFTAAATVTGCANSGPPNVQVVDLAVSANTSEVSAAYGTLVNSGGGADTLLAVRCDCSDVVTMHHSERADGRSRMLAADRIDVPAGKQIALVPAGSHLMLEQLNDELVAGDTVELTFEFERSDEISYDVPVVEPAELVDRVEPRTDEGT